MCQAAVYLLGFVCPALRALDCAFLVSLVFVNDHLCWLTKAPRRVWIATTAVAVMLRTPPSPPPPPALSQTRFLTKYRHKDGRVVLKVTNDIECLKFASDNVADVKNIDRLAGWFLSQSSRKEVLKAPGVGAGSGVAAPSS
jgi:hypothetical protein